MLVVLGCDGADMLPRRAVALAIFLRSSAKDSCRHGAVVRTGNLPEQLVRLFEGVGAILEDGGEGPRLHLFETHGQRALVDSGRNVLAGEKKGGRSGGTADVCRYSAPFKG